MGGQIVHYICIRRLVLVTFTCAIRAIFNPCALSYSGFWIVYLDDAHAHLSFCCGVHDLHNKNIAPPLVFNFFPMSSSAATAFLPSSYTTSVSFYHTHRILINYPSSSLEGYTHGGTLSFIRHPHGPHNHLITICQHNNIMGRQRAHHAHLGSTADCHITACQGTKPRYSRIVLVLWGNLNTIMGVEYLSGPQYSSGGYMFSLLYGRSFSKFTARVPFLFPWLLGIILGFTLVSSWRFERCQSGCIPTSS